MVAAKLKLGVRLKKDLGLQIKNHSNIKSDLLLISIIKRKISKVIAYKC